MGRSPVRAAGAGEPDRPSRRGPGRRRVDARPLIHDAHDGDLDRDPGRPRRPRGGRRSRRRLILSASGARAHSMPLQTHCCMRQRMLYRFQGSSSTGRQGRPTCAVHSGRRQQTRCPKSWNSSLRRDERTMDASLSLDRRPGSGLTLARTHGPNLSRHGDADQRIASPM